MSDEAPRGLDIDEILRLIPQRYPLLLVDRVESVVARESIVAVKNVSVNEPYFVGHFPERPIMPGVVMLEAVLQAATVLGFVSEPDRRKEDGVYVVAMDNVKFKRKVRPGDVMVTSIRVLKIKGPFWQFDAAIEVGGEKALTGRFLAAFEDGNG